MLSNFQELGPFNHLFILKHLVSNFQLSLYIIFIFSTFTTTKATENGLTVLVT